MINIKKNKEDKKNKSLVFVILFLFIISIVSGLYVFSSDNIEFNQIKKEEIFVKKIMMSCVNLSDLDCIDNDNITIQTNKGDFLLGNGSTIVYDNNSDLVEMNYDLFSVKRMNLIRLIEESSYEIYYVGSEESKLKPTIVLIKSVYQSWGVNETGYRDFISINEVNDYYVNLERIKLNRSVQNGIL